MGHPHASTDIHHVEDAPHLDDVKAALESNLTTEKTEEVFPTLTPEEAIREKKLLRKIDLIILPLCIFNYFFSAMDRGDIGNAKLAGFMEDNNLSNVQFSAIVSFFYIGYIAFQMVGGIAIGWIEAYLLLGLANISWGAFTILLVTSKNMVAPSILRVLIGVAEGLAEINCVFLTLWYTPREYAVRVGLWFSFGVLANSFNGLLAYGILKGNSGSLKPWQLLFLIEGILPVVFGSLMIWLYPPRPEKVKKFFTEEEKVMIIRRSRRAYNTPEEKITFKQAVSVFAQPQMYGMCTIYFVVIWASAGFSTFLPSIINGLGYSTVTSQLLSVPFSVLGFLSVNFFCFWSDRSQKRGLFVIGLALTTLVGYVLLMAIPTATAPRIVGLAFIAIGNYPLIPIMLTWIYVNTIGISHRVIAIPLQNVFGQLGGFAVPYAFINPPRYTMGTTATVALLAALVLITVILEGYFARMNKLKDAKAASDPAWVDLNRTKTFNELGTRHPEFRYTL